MARANAVLTDQTTWYALGYTEPPFCDLNKSTAIFFKSQALVNTLNKLCTLDTSETCISILVGEAGCGKTTCLKSVKKIRTSYHNKLIQATKGLTPQNLIKAIFEHNRPAHFPSTEDCIGLLKTLTSKNDQIRILIDRAHNLSTESLALIKTLAQLQPNGSQIQFVLSCNNTKPLLSLLNNPQIKTQTIQLKNLTRAETERYIQLKLQQNQTKSTPTAPPKEFFDQLFQKTQGNISKINTAASTELLQHLKEQRESDPQPATQNQQTVPLAGLLLMGLCISAYFQTPWTHADKHNSSLKTIPIVTEAKPQMEFNAKTLSKLLYLLSQPQT